MDRNSLVMDARIRAIDLEEEHETAQQSVQHLGERHEQEAKAEPGGFAEDYEVLTSRMKSPMKCTVGFRCDGSVSSRTSQP